MGNRIPQNEDNGQVPDQNTVAVTQSTLDGVIEIFN
jgi:hypothetical protein